MTYATYFNSTKELITKTIIETEDLNLSWGVFVNALGDTMIEVSGSKEDLRIFVDIYRMVGGE